MYAIMQEMQGHCFTVFQRSAYIYVYLIPAKYFWAKKVLYNIWAWKE